MKTRRAKLAASLAAVGVVIGGAAFVTAQSEPTVEDRLQRLECEVFGENCQPDPTPPPAPECEGTQVDAGANLHNVVGGKSGTFCLEAGTYNLGATPLQLGPNVTIVGTTGTRSSEGAIDAPTKIIGTAPLAVIEAGASNTFRWLDISGSSPGSACQPDCGRGIKSGPDMLVEYSRIHNNSNNGIGGGVASTVTVVFSELDNNGHPDFQGTYGGIKQAASKAPSTLIVSDSYVHDNIGQGIWGDRCQDRMVAERNLVTDNSRTGIYWETNMAPSLCPNTTSRSALIADNEAIGNGSDTWDAGIKIRNSPNADVGFNSTRGNTSHGIRLITNSTKGSMEGNFVHDNTSPDGIEGCSISGVKCSNNDS